VNGRILNNCWERYPWFPSNMPRDSNPVWFQEYSSLKEHVSFFEPSGRCFKVSSVLKCARLGMLMKQDNLGYNTC
jgi:hypothetical protein